MLSHGSCIRYKSINNYTVYNREGVIWGKAKEDNNYKKERENYCNQDENGRKVIDMWSNLFHLSRELMVPCCHLDNLADNNQIQ